MKTIYKIILPIACLIAISFYPEISIGYSNGSPGGKTGSPSDISDCTGCHSNAGIGSGATITTNIPSTGYIPGDIYTITGNITQSGINKFGFEITAEELNPGSAKTGTFFVTNATETKFVNNNNAVSHRVGGTSGSNARTWSMDWEAPSAGTGSVAFYGGFIAANSNGNNSGDTYHEVSLIVNEAAPVFGCTDSSALNYDATATVDDGSCEYFCAACDLPNNTISLTPAGEVLYNVSTDIAGIQFDVIGGAITNAFGGASDSAGFSVSFSPTTVIGFSFSLNVIPAGCGTLINLSSSSSINGLTNIVFSDVSGNAINVVYTSCLDVCIDSSLIDTTVTCIAVWDPVCGCDDVTYSNPCEAGAAGLLSWSTGECTVYGCTDPNAFNYDANATVDDGSCIPFIYGCTDPIALNYNATATSDDGSCLYPGCPDPNATNYDPNANFDDGSCIYSASCSGDLITGLYVSDIIDDRCVLNFDNMNTYDFNGNQICRVDQIRIKYRPVGTSSWSQKNIASPTGYNNGVCNSTQKTDKNLYGLTLATEYQWQVKVWYCDGQTTGWAQGPNFTTASECPNVGNTNAYGSTPTRATFTWDDSNGAYEFLRIKIRIDSISNPTLSDFIQVGGAGVPYGTFTKNKNGLTSGETYRGQGRTWCDPNGGAYNSLGWTSFGVWTQPTNRIDLGQSIKDLDIYPNPSNDIFNISFTSEDVQDLRVRVMNVIGEDLIVEDLQQFVGEYTKKITLGDNVKGIYFLEIATNNSVVNKKLILQ